MLSRIRRKNSINSRSAFRTRSAVRILYLVCIFLPGLQSAVCIFYWPDWYYCFCSSEPQVRTEISGLEKKFLVRLFCPLWLMCELYVEELPGTSKLIEQWLLYTNSRRTQMRGLTLIPFYVVTACVEMNPLRIPLLWTFRLLDLSCIFRSSEMWFEIIIFNKTIRTFYFFPC